MRKSLNINLYVICLVSFCFLHTSLAFEIWGPDEVGTVWKYGIEWSSTRSFGPVNMTSDECEGTRTLILRSKNITTELACFVFEVTYAGTTVHTVYGSGWIANFADWYGSSGSIAKVVDSSYITASESEFDTTYIESLVVTSRDGTPAFYFGTVSSPILVKSPGIKEEYRDSTSGWSNQGWYWVGKPYGLWEVEKSDDSLSIRSIGPSTEWIYSSARGLERYQDGSGDNDFVSGTSVTLISVSYATPIAASRHFAIKQQNHVSDKSHSVVISIAPQAYERQEAKGIAFDLRGRRVMRSVGNSAAPSQISHGVFCTRSSDRVGD